MLHWPVPGEAMLGNRLAVRLACRGRRADMDLWLPVPTVGVAPAAAPSANRARTCAICSARRRAAFICGAASVCGAITDRRPLAEGCG
jgi:hypothetical protein